VSDHLPSRRPCSSAKIKLLNVRPLRRGAPQATDVVWPHATTRGREIIARVGFP
jgi:hypothetical protein